MDPIELSLFSSRMEAICQEMGAVLQRSAFSPNVKDRLDFSCAVFDKSGALCAQAAHIPVHMGSMAYAMAAIVETVKWKEGDMLVLNDPFLGGTHLPDVTLIAPFFFEKQLSGFVVNRAHHADIGSDVPGSMPLTNCLDDEGLLISPTLLLRKDKIIESLMGSIAKQTRNENQTRGDFTAQISANRTGLKRLGVLANSLGLSEYTLALEELNKYAQRLAQTSLAAIPDGEYKFKDVMDSDGMGNVDISIEVTIKVDGSHIHVDFDGTADQVQGNINCPLSVAAAGVYYVFRCLMPAHTPNCQGSLSNITLCATQGSLLNATRPAAVAAGNVETSTRVVDVVMGALAKAIPNQIPAASQGSMNNLAMGAHKATQSCNKAWNYYETIGGGMGAGSSGPGQSAVQTHMTNTRNTPTEVLEMDFPLRLTRYQVRPDSGGKGRYDGGNGILREFEFLSETTVTLLTERRRHPAWGLHGGEPGSVGINRSGNKLLPDKITWQAKVGERLMIASPGGGGWGKPG
jgi:N-methylhydantoinase B